jgi:hypothetical protein
VSVAAVAARRVDRSQLLEIELGDGLQLVQPGAVFVLQIDERGYRRRPRLGRGGMRRSAAGGMVWLCRRSLARRRAWR